MREAKEAQSHEAAAVDDDHRDPFECLPVDILHRILSLLPSNKERARTTFVSKLFRSAYSSHPMFSFESFMDFDVRDFLPVHVIPTFREYSFFFPDSHTHDRMRQMTQINNQFLSFVDEAVARYCERSLRIQRLKLCTILFEINHSLALFDKWIGMALDNGVQELHLEFDKVGKHWSYTVPARVFSSASMKTITLLGKDPITSLGSLSTTVNMTSLQSLNFDTTPLDELMLQKLLRGCPLLEEINLHSCKPLTQVVISGPNNLRRISISCNKVQRVEIEAPNLEELECTNWEKALAQVALERCPRVKHLKLRGCTITHDHLRELLSKFPLLESLTIGQCMMLAEITILNPLIEKITIEECDELVDVEIGSARVKQLKLRGCAIGQDRFLELLSKFPLLESLSVEPCWRFQKLMISNPLLEKIELEGCDGSDDIEINSPNLSFFRYETGNMELPLIRIPNLTALSICEASFETGCVSVLEPNWFVKLSEFLTRSCTFRSISLEFVLEIGDRGIVQDTSDALALLPYDVDCLNLEILAPRPSHVAIMNMMLSLCHPTTLRVKPYFGGRGRGCGFLKFLCEKLENIGGDDADRCYCSSGQKKCWLHELKGVEVERVTLYDYSIVGPLDWRTLRELVPYVSGSSYVYFKLHWK